MPHSRFIPVAQIAAVHPDSIAAELGLAPGDLLLAVNGAPLTDYIAYRFAIADEELELVVARGDEQWCIELEKEADDDLGLTFTEDVFDGMRRCTNRCVFCFEEQMPAGMRSSLRLRDDDVRLSFLHGNFVTLTNVRAGEMARIIREHLSPLYVSVHATDPDTRRRLLGVRRAPDLRRQLRELGAAGIEVHTQIVFCPGWNDGAILEETLNDLTALYPTVQSIGIVPVGLTAHRPAGPEVTPVTPAGAEALLARVAHWSAACLAQMGTRLVYAADEFYLLAGIPFPPTEAYEEFPQRENGIGLARLFLDALDDLIIPPAAVPMPLPVALVTGTSAAPLLAGLAERLRAAGYRVDTIAVPNHFYGGGVSVAGLLTGSDLQLALAGTGPWAQLLLPALLLNGDGLFLDDRTPAELERALGWPLVFCEEPEDVVSVLQHG
jgi:putative radical SAM enzyme (TIGR03279 family)